MAAIVLTRRNGVLEAAGDLVFLRRADPCRDAQGGESCSLEAGWRWHDGGLDLFADRLGMIPIFWRREPDRVLLASTLSELCATARSLHINHAALAVFLRLGFFLADSTPLEGVEVLSPASRARLTDANLEIRRPVEFSAGGATRVDHDQTIQRYIDLFRGAVAKRAIGALIALPLSGGRDSRHILFELLRLGRRPAFAVTYQEAGLNDIAAARELCSRLGLSHVVTELPPIDFVRIEDHKNRQTHFLTDEHYWFASVAAVLRERSADLFFDGMGGDVLSNGLFFDAALAESLRRGDFDAVAERLLGPRRTLPFLSREWQSATSWEVARDVLVAEVRRHLDQINPVKSFYFWNRTRREIALAPLVMAEGIQVALPYLDPELLDFFMALPNDFAAPGLHDTVIRTAFPQYADVGYAKKGLKFGEPVSFGERWRTAQLALRLARQPYASPGFAWPRIARSMASTRLDSTHWWLDRLVYLEGLLTAAHVDGGCDGAGVPTRDSRRVDRSATRL